MIRNAVRVLLLNADNQLLLMCLEGFDIGTLDGKRNDRFWCTIGGGIEEGESIAQAAFREIYEETGIAQYAVNLGPVAWYGEVDLLVKGTPTRFKELYIVARTKKRDVFLCCPTDDEKQAVKKLQWFSLDDIKQCPDIIFPVLLPEYLPAILAGYYPDKPIEIDLKVKSKK